MGRYQGFVRGMEQRLQPVSLPSLAFEGFQAATRKCTKIYQSAQAIDQSMAETWVEERTTEKIETALLQCPERSDQIAAVHGRYEQRRKRLEGPSVVPVE